MAATQKRFNEEVMSQPFYAEHPEQVNAYIRQAMKKRVKPQVYQGEHWKPGYTCQDMLQYSWSEYRDCMYYHRYYGHDYPDE